MLLLSSMGFSAVPNKVLNNAQKEIAIENFLVGLKSDNAGLQSSSAYMLGEFTSKEAVVPLMKILKSNSKEELRIQAALSLLKIGDARGIFAIRQAIKFDNSKRVRDICNKFYNAYISKELTSPSM